MRADVRAASTCASVVSLLLLAFAGYIKATAPLAWIPFDIALLGAFGTVVLIIRRLVLNQVSTVGLMPILVLWAAFLVGIVPGPGWNPYAVDKVFELFTVAILSAMGGFVLLRDHAVRRAWLIGVVLLGALAAVLALTSPADRSVVARLTLEGGSTIGLGRATGASVVVIMSYAMASASRRVSMMILTTSLAAIMIWTGSRGPVLAAMVSVLIVAVVTRRRGVIGRAALVSGSILVVSYLAIRSDIVPARLIDFDGSSAGTRLILWAETVEIIKDWPLGIGWGNLRTHLAPWMTLDSGWIQYPHNLFLEVFSEAGWLAGVVLIVALSIALWTQVRATQTPVEMAMCGLLFFFLVNAMVSGDISGNRGLWVAFGSALTIGAARRCGSEPGSSERVIVDHAKNGGVAGLKFVSRDRITLDLGKAIGNATSRPNV